MSELKNFKNIWISTKLKNEHFENTHINEIVQACENVIGNNNKKINIINLIILKKNNDIIIFFNISDQNISKRINSLNNCISLGINFENTKVNVSNLNNWIETLKSFLKEYDVIDVPK